LRFQCTACGAPGGHPEWTWENGAWPCSAAGRVKPVDWKQALLDQIRNDPNRPRDWTAARPEEEAAARRFGDLLRDESFRAVHEQNAQIERDMALLMRAGIEFKRIMVGYHQGETRRSLLVDGKPVQDYVITYVTEESADK